MPPVVALALCIILVALLLRLTVRSTEGKSRALWIPTIWILVVASRPVGRWFNLESVSMSEGSEARGSLADQLLLGMLILLALIVLFKRRISWQTVLKDNIWLFVLLLYEGLSILWSDYPFASLKRWVRAAGAAMSAMVVMTGPNPFKALELIIRRTAYVLIPFSLVLIKYFPALGVAFGRWSGARMTVGVCMQKNGLGLLCMLSAFFFIWDLLRKRRLNLLKYDKGGTLADFFILLLAFYLMKGAGTNSYSATSVGVLLIGLCAMFALSTLRAHPKNITGVVAVTAMVGATTLISASTILNWSPIGWWVNFLGRNESLTGRVDIWERIYTIVPRWSLLGTGFGGFWGLPYSWVVMGQMSGHNGYFDVYVELGFVGIFFLSIFLLSLWRKLSLLAKHDFDWSLMGICLLLISLAYNYTESDFLKVSGLLWTILLFISFVLSGEASSKPKSQADK